MPMMAAHIIIFNIAPPARGLTLFLKREPKIRRELYSHLRKLRRYPKQDLDSLREK
jgi:hypothetical protein